MTEKEWLASEEPERMLLHLGGAASDRKLRLFMCACCRRVWGEIIQEQCRASVEVAEKYLEGEANEDEFARAADDVDWAWSLQVSGGSVYAEEAAMYPTRSDPLEGAVSCASCAADCVRSGESQTKESEQSAQADLLRCIFGNPFHPPAAPVQSRHADSVAKAAYSDRAPDGLLDNAHLAVLSDALEEAGCTDEAILSHLRSPGPHVRGCWALDLVLGRN